MSIFETPCVNLCRILNALNARDPHVLSAQALRSSLPPTTLCEKAPPRSLRSRSGARVTP